MAQYIPNDPLFGLQWHLLNTGQTGFGPGNLDLNVTYVWPDYTGTGVTIAVYDNGVEYGHPDLNDNYDASQHVIINGSVSDAHHLQDSEVGGSSGFNSLNFHGTAMAGIAAAEDNNEGVVGVAFDANIVGVYTPIFGFNIPKPELVQAFQQLDNFEVALFASGGRTFVDGAGNANWVPVFDAFQEAVANGRNGLGTVMLNSTHNNGPGFGGYDTNASQFDSHRTFVHVGGVLDTGEVAPNATRSAAMLVSGFTGFQAGGQPRNIWTTDLTGADGAGSDDYSSVGGTTSAVSQIAGVTALMLEANPDLGWRDVQNILATAARHTGSAIGGPTVGNETEAWAFNGSDNWNGGGRHYSRDYGFGVVDALAAVRLAETWHIGGLGAATSANEANRSATTNHGSVAIPDNTGTSVSVQFNITQDIRVEAAQLRLSFNHARAQDLKITLISPDGTSSIIFNPVSAEAGTGNSVSTGWRFNSQEFRGELGAGTWTAVIEDLTSGNTGSLSGTSALVLFGSGNTTTDRYVYTNAYSDYAALAGRTTLTDTDGGSDTINAAAVTATAVIDLNAGSTSTIDGQSLTIAAGSTIENAVGGDGNDTLTGNALANILHGGRGNDTVTGNDGDDMLDGAAGEDTAVYSQNLSQYTLQDFGSVIVVTGPEGTDTLRAIEHLQFANGALATADDGNPLFDALFYLSRNPDVFAAGVDPLTHYNTFGWREGRDPNGFFDSSGYLAVNRDVAAGGVNPLDHFHQFGWREGRDPSADFDVRRYLINNPDVAAAGVDPLAHYLAHGRAEGRPTYAAIGDRPVGDFDAQYYLFHNPDVAAAGVDPLGHFNTFGWHEGRNPNAFFDTAGYLSHYSDVAAAGVNPLHHYETFGWHEGRDPAAHFDTAGYLAANPDVAAAGVDPLGHFLTFGIYEGRTAVNDGLWH